MAWTPIKMNSGINDQLIAAKAQAGNNSLYQIGQMTGEAQIADQGISNLVKQSTLENKYANSNVPFNQLTNGLETSNYSQEDGLSGGGSNTSDPKNQSGDLALGKSMTMQPQTSPDSETLEPSDAQLDTSGLEQRLADYAMAGRGHNLNEAHKIYQV